MENEKGNVNTISLIMEVEEIMPEETPSDSDSTDCVILPKCRTTNVSVRAEVPIFVKDDLNSENMNPSLEKNSVKEPEMEGKIQEPSCISKPLEDENSKATGQSRNLSEKDHITTLLPEYEKTAIKTQTPLLELQPVASENDEIQNTSLEEKLTAMFEEGKKECSGTADNNQSISAQTLEEQLTELFQDKSDTIEISCSVTNTASASMEDNLIAIFEEDDSGKSPINHVGTVESQPHTQSNGKDSETSACNEILFSKNCSVLLEKNVLISSNEQPNIQEKKITPLKRMSTEGEMNHVDLRGEMKEAKVVLKKLKLSSLKILEHKPKEESNKDMKIAQHKSVAKRNYSSQNAILKKFKEKSSKITSKSSPLQQNTSKISALTTVVKTKDKHHLLPGKFVASSKISGKQEIQKKKVRISRQHSAETSTSEKLKEKPRKQWTDMSEKLQNFDLAKNKTSELPNMITQEPSGPVVVKRKPGRPPLHRNKESSSLITNKKKYTRAINKTQESSVVSRVSERLQLKMMKSRAMRKRKLNVDKRDGMKANIQKESAKREHILNLRNTALSLAKRRKHKTFSTYGLARKKRLLNAVKNASTKLKQLTLPSVEMKQMATKQKDSAIKDNIDHFPNVTVALTPVSVKVKKNVNALKNTSTKIENYIKADKKNVNAKVCNLIAESNFTDSNIVQKHSLQRASVKEQHNINKKEYPVKKRPIVTRSKGEISQKPLLQQKKGGIAKRGRPRKVNNVTKLDSVVVNGIEEVDTKEKNSSTLKDITACGLNVRSIEGIVELLVDDANNVTASDSMEGRKIISKSHGNLECDSSTDKASTHNKELSTYQKHPAVVQVPCGMTDAQKMVEMRKAIWNLETRIDRYKLRQQAEERMVVYLSSKLQIYENNKYVQALMRMLKDAAPGPQQNQDAVFITDLLLGYCPDNDGYEKES